MFLKLCIAMLLLATSTASIFAQSNTILVQSTTSTQNSGLYDYLIPIFTKETGIRVNVVAVGTGQAIRNASNGDADVLLVHAKAAENEFVASGNGVERFNLMYNDFILIGPDNDLLNLSNYETVADAMKAIANSDQIWVSRGDDSGTHKKELSLWADIEITPEPADLYRETGSGMGATIRATVEMQGYTMTDRATWIAYENKSDAKIVFEGDPPLFNQYGIIAVNPEVHPHVNTDGATTFIEWMLSAHGQELIAAYTLDDQQLFYPNAK